MEITTECSHGLKSNEVKRSGNNILDKGVCIRNGGSY